MPYQDFPTADGYMILAIGNDAQFARFCGEAGRPELSADARFATNAERVRNRGVLIPLLKQITVTRTTAEWIAALESVAVPCGPINAVDQTFADEQVQHLGIAIPMSSPDIGETRVVGQPVHLAAIAQPEVRRATPRLGEHTDEVLEWLGYDEAKIASLRERGVI